MSKLLAAVLSCAFLSTGNIMGPTLSLDPLPPTQGQDAVLTVTGGTHPSTYDLEWVPAGAGPPTVTTDASGKATITMPDNADALNITGNGATALATPVKDA